MRKFASEYLKNPEAVEGAYFTWSLGFMTAMNLHAATGAVDGKKTFQNLASLDSLKSSLRIYCNAHPLALYMDAVIDLYRSLETRQMPEPKKNNR